MRDLPVAVWLSVTSTVASARERVHSIGAVVPGRSRATVAGTCEPVTARAFTRPESATSVAAGRPSSPGHTRNRPSASAVAPRTSSPPSGAWATLEWCSSSWNGAAVGSVMLRAYSGAGVWPSVVPGTP